MLHNLKFITFATQIILYKRIWLSFFWCLLYVLGETGVGTSIVGGLHKVLKQ